MTEAEAAYIAGLFDGEGTITHKKYKEKKTKGTYDCWRISMEIAMTDRSVLVWVNEVLGCGTLNKKPRKNGHKMQYRWRCVFRDAFHVCCILFLGFLFNVPNSQTCLLYTSPSPRDRTRSRMPSSA